LKMLIDFTSLGDQLVSTTSSDRYGITTCVWLLTYVCSNLSALGMITSSGKQLLLVNKLNKVIRDSVVVDNCWTASQCYCVRNEQSFDDLHGHIGGLQPPCNYYCRINVYARTLGSRCVANITINYCQSSCNDPRWT
jgi:hypothetical protein